MTRAYYAAQVTADIDMREPWSTFPQAEMPACSEERIDRSRLDGTFGF